VSASHIADVCEDAIRRRDAAAMLPILHPRVQATMADRTTYTGIDEVTAWGRGVFSPQSGSEGATLTVVERYVDEPVAVLVLMCTPVDNTPGTEYTVALITLDDTLVRIVIDA
jgi:hypothetical protein